MELLNIIEWTGSFAAIAGTFILVFGLAPITTTWVLWCVSNLLHGSLFIYNEQFGLLSLQAGLFALSAIGYINLKMSDKTNLPKKMLNIFFFSSFVILAYVLYDNAYNGWNTFKVMEWTGSMLSLAASSLMSIQNKNKDYAWPMWVLGGLFLILITIQTGQFGILALQGAFFVLNIIGLHKHFIKPKFNKAFA